MATAALPPPATVSPWRYGYKFVLLTGHCLLCVLVAVTLPLYRKHMPRISTWWYRRLLTILNIKLEVSGERPRQTVLVIANHVSWMDIIVLGSLLDAAFVSKAEVNKWPVLGTIARAIGTVFLPRGGFKTTEVAARIAERLRQRRNVVLFPQATTSAQPTPERFHARLFAAAIEYDFPVKPVAIHYMPDAQPQTGHHPWAPWVNDASLGKHLYRLLKLKQMTVRIQLCPNIEAGNYARQDLAKKTHAAITAALLNPG